MGRRFAIPEEPALRMLESFRKLPGNYSLAAAESGLSSLTCKRAWTEGWPHAPDRMAWIRRPIAEMIQEEQQVARARMLEDETKARALAIAGEAIRQQQIAEQARTQATDARTQEGQMISLARSSSIQLLQTLVGVSNGVRAVGRAMQASLEKLAYLTDKNGNPIMAADGLPAMKPLEPKETADLMRLVNSLTTSLRQANDAAQKAMEMERLYLGAPQSITANVTIEADISLEEARRRVKAAQQAIERAALTVDAGPLEEVDK